MGNAKSLTLCHFWVAFGLFLPAVLLGAWQMLMRSPLPAPLDDPDAYYASVTLRRLLLAGRLQNVPSLRAAKERGDKTRMAGLRP